MQIIVRNGRKSLVMDESLQILMNPRKMSDDEHSNDLVDIQVLNDEFDNTSDILDGEDSPDEETDRDVDEPPPTSGDDDDDEPEEIPSPHQAPPPVSSHLPPPRTREEINNSKRELLYHFDRLERKGVRLPRRFSMASDITEMQAEYDRLVRDREADAGIKFQKKVMVALVSGIEFMNKKFDPFDVYLEGWGETVNENLDDYDDVLEELHAKYKGKARMAPELKLMMMIIGSAFMYHLTNTMFKAAPALGQVVKDNPDLMKQFAAATANTMQKSGNDATGMAGIFSGLFGGGGGGSQPVPVSDTSSPMRGPSSARVAEVQQFMQRQQGVPRASVRPPLPVAGREISIIRENSKPKRGSKSQLTKDLRGEEDDLLEIMSSGSEETISDITSGGRRKRTLSL
jgi:hypothetical protein